MTTTTMELLDIYDVYGGVFHNFNTYARNISSIGGRLQFPGKRTGNVPLAGKDGQAVSSDKRYDQNVITLDMWIRGCDDDGQIPTGSSSRIEFFKNYDALQRILALPAGFLFWTLPDGSQRFTQVELLDTIDFTVVGSNPLAKFSVAYTLPGVFWNDADSVTGTEVIVNPAYFSDHDLTSFSGGSAPDDGSIITVRGPYTSFSMVDHVSNHQVSFDAAIPAGQDLRLDCSTFECLLNGVSALTNLRYTGGSFLRLQPDSNGLIRVNIRGVGGTSASQVTIQGHRMWVAA